MQVPRAAVIGPSDAGTERLARDVEVYLRAGRITRPLLRIVTQGTWPSAIGVALFLYKQGVPIAFDPEWRAMVGGPLADAGTVSSQTSLAPGRFPQKTTSHVPDAHLSPRCDCYLKCR
jgi:hypothetical protein